MRPSLFLFSVSICHAAFYPFARPFSTNASSDQFLQHHIYAAAAFPCWRIFFTCPGCIHGVAQARFPFSMAISFPLSPKGPAPLPGKILPLAGQSFQGRCPYPPFVGKSSQPVSAVHTFLDTDCIFMEIGFPYRQGDSPAERKWKSRSWERAYFKFSRTVT